MSILLYGCTTWVLTKRLEKKLNGNYTRMPRAIRNNPRKQQPTKQQLYGHLPPITKTIQVRQTNIRDKTGGVRTNSKAIYSSGHIHMDEQKQDDQLEPIYNGSLPIQEHQPGTMDDSHPCWQRDVMMMMMMMMIWN